MIAALVVLMLQAGTIPQTHSIRASECRDTTAEGGEIVVCAPTKPTARLPLPDERAPVGPLMITGAAERMVDPAPRPIGGAPCSSVQSGCLVGFGPSPAMVRSAVGAIGKAFAKKPDKSNRVPIVLDDQTP